MYSGDEILFVTMTKRNLDLGLKSLGISMNITMKVHNDDEIKNVTLLVTRCNSPERFLEFNL